MGNKILIVDDEVEQIEYASSVLTENGYEAVSATNGAEGLEMVGSERPDLVLLDIMMPERGGIAMYRELRGDDDMKEIPVIIVTGVSRGEQFEERILGKESGMAPPDGYIEKPMKPELLVEMIRDLLA